VNRHASHGRLLTGPALSAAFYTNAIPFVCSDRPVSQQAACRDSVLAQSSHASDTAFSQASDTAIDAPRALQEMQEKYRRQDSLTRSEGGGEWHRKGLDTLVVGAQPDASENEERTKSYIGGFFYDSIHAGGSWDLDGGDWAAVIYVVVGAVVVSAFVIYAPYLLYQLIANDGRDPVFHEIGLRYSYSGKTWSDGGPPLYRNANLLGLRYAVGLDKSGFGLGLSMEGGYINLSLQDMQNPTQAFDFSGGYLVAGPMVRFGNNRPASFTLEFLNGTSDHGSIGWISKSRMTVQGRVGPSGLLVGAHLGAVFYDLKFYDGLVQRQGDFNRDLSLILGVDTGWEF
jgi:hypothetical protein